MSELNIVNNIYKKFFTFLFINILLATFCFSSETPTSNTEGELDTVTLHLKWKHQFQFAGYYAAKEKGFYKQAGLDVNIVESESKDKLLSNVINGDADFGIAMSDLIRFRAKGNPVVALASIFQHSPLVILAPKNNGIENIHDLKGKTIALESHVEQLLIYLESEGLPSSKLNIVPHDYDINKLISGEISAMSAYISDEPFILKKSGIEYNVFSPRSAGIDFYGDILFTSERQISDNPERVNKFIEASLKGWNYALDNSDEIVDLILSKYSTRHSRKHLLYEAWKTERLIMRDVVEIGYMNPGRWVHIIDTFKESHVIPEDFSLDGFIYDKNPQRDLSWLYLSFVGTILIAGLSFFLVWKFFKLNQALKCEVTEHIKHIDELKDANIQIKKLKGIIPICMHCKGIRDDKGYWNQLEKYISEHSDAQFSHGICEKCLTKHHPEAAYPIPSSKT